jgi:hypothetical protein
MNLFHTFAAHCILFEIRNILLGARKYLYCLNNNLLFMEKIPFSTIFISKKIVIWKLKYKVVVKLKFLVKKQFLQQKTE